MTKNHMKYESKIGTLFLTSEDSSLTGVYFGEKEWQTSQREEKSVECLDSPLFNKVTKWFDAYFSGERPEIDFPLAPQGTIFQQKVWQILREIPNGGTTTYGEIGQKVAKELGKEQMSAQAVGGAVGSNPISIIVPCHRVIGKNGSVTGYGGGIDRKLALFELEKTDQETYFVPKNIKEARRFVN